MKLKLCNIEQYFLPVPFECPLSFGKQKVEKLEKLRVAVQMQDLATGRWETGWGEVPLNYPWFWPECNTGCNDDPAAIMRIISMKLEWIWMSTGIIEHPLITAYELQDGVLHEVYAFESENAPFLAWQVINAAYDIAFYDAAARLCNCGVYDLFDDYLIPVKPEYFFRKDPIVTALMKPFRFRDALLTRPQYLGVWHMVGTCDPLRGDGKDLAQWIIEGGIKRLKIKLSADVEKDMVRLREIFSIASSLGVEKYSLDYNGPGMGLGWLYDFLMDLKNELPEFYDRLCYIEQPVAPGLTGSVDEVRRISAEKDLLVDEGAGSWEELYEYYKAGWSGVALKICKSQTSSLLMFALSRVLHKRVTVMDLTNPSLAQISHVQLAAHMSDDRELESNGIQYCPEASLDESAVHPGLFQRWNGRLELSSLTGPGYGYRMDEINKLKKERTE